MLVFGKIRDEPAKLQLGFAVECTSWRQVNNAPVDQLATGPITQSEQRFSREFMIDC